MKQVAEICQGGVARGKGSVRPASTPCGLCFQWALQVIVTDTGLDLRGGNSPPFLGVGTDDRCPVPSS